MNKISAEEILNQIPDDLIKEYLFTKGERLKRFQYEENFEKNIALIRQCVEIGKFYKFSVTDFSSSDVLCKSFFGRIIAENIHLPKDVNSEDSIYELFAEVVSITSGKEEEGELIDLFYYPFLSFLTFHHYSLFDINEYFFITEVSEEVFEKQKKVYQEAKAYLQDKVMFEMDYD